VQEQEKELLDEMKELHKANSWALKDMEKNGLNSMMIVMNVVDKIPHHKDKKEAYISKKIKEEFNISI
jgi:hypothetical protein